MSDKWILIVDDEESILAVLKSSLKETWPGIPGSYRLEWTSCS